MKILKSNLDLEQFYKQLESTGQRLLMLDYDGTLAPFRIERDEAVPYPDIIDTLDGLFASDKTRVVLISGRSVENLSSLLDFEMLPELWGSHGLERRTPDGKYSVAELPEETTQRLAELYTWIGQGEIVNICEFKPSGAAFHWRGLPDETADEIKNKITERWKPVAENSTLELHEFDGGIEIRVSGTNKATPVKALLEQTNSEAAIAYLGDDLTDEDAFGALPENALGVLVRDELRETQADIWIKPPDELREFLSRWL